MGVKYDPVKRYNNYKYSGWNDTMFEEDNGEWVKYVDVIDALRLIKYLTTLFKLNSDHLTEIKLVDDDVRKVFEVYYAIGDIK